MDWISIDDKLPDNNTLCWAYIPNRGIILRLYRQDGFGMGDTDYEIAYWMEFKKPQIPNCIVLDRIPLSIVRGWDHKVGDFEQLRQHLAQ